MKNLEQLIESQKITDENKIIMESAVDNFEDVSDMLKFIGENGLHLADTYYEHNYFCGLLDKKDEVRA